MHLSFDEDGDMKLSLPNGESMRFDSSKNNPNGVSFIRFYDAEGNEVVGWNCDEWKEEPEEVMGAIFGKLCSTFPNPSVNPISDSSEGYENGNDSE